jgi:hypothetical protein
MLAVGLSMSRAMTVTTESRLDTYFCEIHGFIAPGEAFHWTDATDYYCLRCLAHWVPRVLSKVRVGIKPIEPV